MAFLDEDDLLSADATDRGDRFGPRDPQRHFLFRRLIAVAAGVLLLILIVLGVRGCLEARQEREFENYVRDLDALASESQQLSEGFFGRLEDPENLSELNFEAEVKADRGAAEGLVSRAEGLDAPGDLTAAQADLVLAFELRRDGLAAISEEIGTALGDEGSDEAIEAIAQHMQLFVASDVMYRRSQAQIDQELEEEGIPEQAPNSQFLPDPDGSYQIEWLDPNRISEALGQITGEEQASGGVHGLGLVEGGVVAQPGDVALTEGVAATVSADAAPEIEVQVENQGDSDESDIPVTVEVDGSAAGEATIEAIAPGEIATVTVPLDPAPATGDTVTLEVFVEPVIGEQVSENNEAAFEVTFE